MWKSNFSFLPLEILWMKNTKTLTFGSGLWLSWKHIEISSIYCPVWSLLNQKINDGFSMRILLFLTKGDQMQEPCIQQADVYKFRIYMEARKGMLMMSFVQQQYQNPVGLPGKLVKKMGIFIGDNILPTLLSYSWRKWTTSGKQRFLCTVQKKHLWRWLQKKGKHWTINWTKSVQNVMHLLAFAKKRITTMLFVEDETKYYCWFYEFHQKKWSPSFEVLLTSPDFILTLLSNYQYHNEF